MTCTSSADGSPIRCQCCPCARARLPARTIGSPRWPCGAETLPRLDPVLVGSRAAARSPCAPGRDTRRTRTCAGCRATRSSRCPALARRPDLDHRALSHDFCAAGDCRGDRCITLASFVDRPFAEGVRDPVWLRQPPCGPDKVNLMRSACSVRTGRGEPRMKAVGAIRSLRQWHRQFAASRTRASLTGRRTISSTIINRRGEAQCPVPALAVCARAHSSASTRRPRPRCPASSPSSRAGPDARRREAAASADFPPRRRIARRRHRRDMRSRSIPSASSAKRLPPSSRRPVAARDALEAHRRALRRRCRVVVDARSRRRAGPHRALGRGDEQRRGGIRHGDAAAAAKASASAAHVDRARPRSISGSSPCPIEPRALSLRATTRKRTHHAPREQPDASRFARHACATRCSASRHDKKVRVKSATSAAASGMKTGSISRGRRRSRTARAS